MTTCLGTGTHRRREAVPIVPVGASRLASRSLTVRFEQINDELGEAAGWNIDDFCVVAFVPSVCGDGNVTGNETCDDGMNNSDENPDACRSSCEPASCGDLVLDAGEECDDGNDIDDDCAGGLLLLGLVALGLRRRR